MANPKIETLIIIIKKKKILIITILLCIILIIALFLPNSQPNNSSTPGPISSTPALTISEDNDDDENEINDPEDQIGKKPVSATWITHQGNSFSIQYPPDWSLQKSNVAGGGEIIVIKPNGIPAEINYPQFLMQTEPITKDPQGRIGQKIEIMKGLGLNKEETTILDKTATKLSGTIPFKTVAGTNVREPIRETSYLFTHNDKIFVIQYSYEGDQINADLENYFNDFITSAHLN